MRRLTRDPNELLPLKHATYQILLALGDGESLHGYAVMQAITDTPTGGNTSPPGTLYAALARMVDERLVEESEPRADESSGGPARRYYKRTAFGRAVARAESERLRALLDVARAQRILGK